MAPIKVSVIGTGMSALVFHCPFILSLPHLYTLHSILERKATPEHSLARDAFPEVKVVTSMEEVLNDKEVDAVWVTTVNSTHFEMGKAILNAGKHLILEKPVTPTFAQAQQLTQLAASKGLILATYHNRRWDSDFLTVKKLIESGKLGDLSEFDSQMDRYKNELTSGSRAWKEKKEVGIGAEYDLGSHVVDQVLYLFGRPAAVTAFIQNSRAIGDPEVFDSFKIFLHYPALPGIPGRSLPLIATARHSILSLISPQPRFTVKGTKGAFTKSGLDVQEMQLKELGNYLTPSNGKKISDADFAFEDKAFDGTLYTLENTKGEKITTERGNYSAWFQNVAEAISKKDSSLLIVKPEQAAEVLEIIEIARQSSAQGVTIKL